MTEKRRIWVIQDGADFYLYTRDPNTPAEGIGLTSARRPFLYALSAPMKVEDFNLEQATKARRWFIDYCDSNNIQPEWTT